MKHYLAAKLLLWAVTKLAILSLLKLARENVECAHVHVRIYKECVVNKTLEAVANATLVPLKGLFTRTVSVKVYHCANGDRPFDGQNGFCLHSYNVSLMETVTETDTETEAVHVNRP